ncbi:MULTISPECIES: folylpolyglutamate synthase/dihydrofolate synthase family protein [unclassified Fusibacter]|uniref:bifunctional folylpolyglutamate synthase/dihydrofolate synthase n=1 Tax=unclassified Fusibacter TaxID=2624464 RepID=UPI0010115D03|nr:MULTISPECIES: folylpolyglutamate synthase/dihydrofolate synthase family protein [unclassified Fusibacter]MCK8058314.1 bifunctional folylpolyglutamate synthase/dihydrofolate synthase [Fusibacter sp. A2]NPE20897.1 bifunctional folylpolyglutamate synthase/dihydrofolate synthase [Fusibacter sp. A1]RXV63101.1 bifunctional folylpolyglutamate synthase/dihydrofolate synthase [Fusibacter sp. A1]
MNYEQAIHYIHDTYKFGSKYGLENIRLLLEGIDNPQDELRFIHIAGTNGKGSTASFIAYALMEAGYKVGTYFSPYLERFNERIQINCMPIGDEDLARHTGIVKKSVDAMLEKGCDHPTEFEIVTSVGFDYFHAQQVDIVVLEVGLGGRLDSTNVIKSPLASVIVPLALDHVQYLGDTIDKIAYEKAGIIKEGCPVVTTVQEEDALEVIIAKADAVGAPYHYSDYRTVKNTQLSRSATTFTYKDVDFKIRLLGEHQIQNACTAFDTLSILNEGKQIQIDVKNILDGFDKTRWMGRVEQVSDNPVVIIDAAHNLHGVQSLVKAIETYQPEGSRIAIFGMMADKAVSDVVGEIIGKFEKIYLVEPDNPRAMKTSELKSEIEKAGFGGEIVELDRVSDAVEVIKSYKNKEVNIYCFGSLYYIGEVRKVLTSEAF